MAKKRNPMSKPKVKKLKEFVFSYAYDEPKYCDFRLTAWTLKEAKRKALRVAQKLI